MPRKPKPEPKREVQRQHFWRPGHDPNDPDAEAGSGWEYLKLSGNTPAETRDFHDALKKSGGPESGVPCMHCSEMTRIVDIVKALDILEQSVVVNGEETAIRFSAEQKARFTDEKVALLMCPNGHLTQFRADVARTLRERWLAKQ